MFFVRKTYRSVCLFQISLLLLVAWTLPLWAGTPKVRILVEGAEIRGTQGIEFDHQGRLLVASVLERAILVVDPQSGRVLERLDSAQGVETPDDVAVGPDGSIYWTAIWTGDIGRLDPDGTSRTLTNLGVGVNPLGFSPDGRLFVGAAVFGNGLFEVDPEGIEPPRTILTSLGGGPNSFDFGPEDGLLYAPLSFTGEVVRVDVDTAVVEEVTSGLQIAPSVIFDPDGRLLASDGGAGVILEVDPETGTTIVDSEPGPGSDTLAFDDHGRGFISNSYDGSIKRQRPNGTWREISRGGLTASGGVAVLPGRRPGRNRVFVGDLFSLSEFNGRNGRRRNYVPFSVFPGELNAFSTVSADGDHLILSSFFFNTVEVWDPDTEEVLQRVADFGVPTNAIRFDGDLVVAELATGQVVRADGTDPSQRTVVASGLAIPSGLAADGDDLYISDWALGTLWQAVDNGAVLDPPRVVATGLSQPEGMVMDAYGKLLVVESGAQRLLEIDPISGAIEVVVGGLGVGADPLPNLPPIWIFSGIDVGANGAIYVGGDRENVIYRIRR